MWALWVCISWDVRSTSTPLRQVSATALSSHQDLASLAGGLGCGSPVRISSGSWRHLYFKVVFFFPVQQHSTIFQELKEWHVLTDPNKRSRSESVQVLQTQTPHSSSLSLSLHERWYQLMVDQIQQLKYQWDPELIWCPIKFFDIAIQQLNVLVSRGKKQLSWVYLACWCFFCF